MLQTLRSALHEFFAICFTFYLLDRNKTNCKANKEISRRAIVPWERKGEILRRFFTFSSLAVSFHIYSRRDKYALLLTPVQRYTHSSRL